VTVIANIGSSPIALPQGNVIATSGPIIGGALPVDTAVWLADDGA
jgi:alpha-glucosidase